MTIKRIRAGVPADLDQLRRKALRKYQRGHPVRDSARAVGRSYETVRKWVHEADRIGFDLALQPRTGPKLWPIEIKQKVVAEYRRGALPKDLMVKYSLPHANYPGLCDQSMPPETSPDHTALAHGAYQKTTDAIIRHDEKWQAWVTRMRTHFDATLAEATTDAERLRIMRLQVDLMEKSSAFDSSEKSLTQILVQIVTELKATHPVGVLL